MSQPRYATMELPPPVPQGPEVWPELLELIEQRLVDIPSHLPAILAELRARRDLGVARYGQTLHRDDGRPEGVDLVQELMDAAVYAMRDAMRAEAIGDRRTEIHYGQRVLDIVDLLVSQLLFMAEREGHHV